MFPSLPQDIQDDLAQLAQRYGQPLTRTVALHATHWFDPLNRTDRYGEVCMVVRRPDGHLLTMTKAFYPRGAYRLMTGGINHGEAVLDAVLRETHEETGLTVNVNRFLAAVAYRVPALKDAPCFYTFAFLLDEVSGTLGAIDEEEQVEDFREIMPEELPALAEFFEHTPPGESAEIFGDWKDWGEFRAVIHRVVSEAL